MLARYLSIVAANGRLSKNTQANYKSYLNQIDAANGGMTASWIKDAIQNKASVESIIAQFNQAMTTVNTKSNWRSALKDFATCIMGIYQANVWAFSDKDLEEEMCKIIARTAIFADKGVVEKVKKGELGRKENLGKGNEWASWDNMTHVRDTRVKNGTVLPSGHIADNNNIANHAIKTAIIKSYGLNKLGNYQQFKDYEVCHIWAFPNMPECYASIANLILVPRAFAQLTDHCDVVKQLLQYEANKRFGYLPPNQQIPVKPTFYNNLKWRVL